MRGVLLLLLLVPGAVACGPPLAEGTWSLVERMSHRCRGGELGLICDDDTTLDPAARQGQVQIDDVGGGRLRLLDVDGRVFAGQSYSDGARFRWSGRQSDAEALCVETREEVLELIAEGEGLGGQRRVFQTRSEGCGVASSSDLGYVVQASRVEVVR
jgi:hypothetical protein